MKTIKIKDYEVGEDNPLLLIAGPCQIESRDHTLKVAKFLRELTAKYPVNFVFKSSFDKANRTSLNSERGIGIDEGLKILQEVATEFDLPVTTDVHLPAQVKAVAEVVHLIQTPAFLCRQTDLMVEAGSYGVPVNIKKAQFVHPLDMRYSIDKVKSHGNVGVMVCERGTCFGYRDLIVDPRSIIMMKELGVAVGLDVTHSVQSMGGGKGKSSGNRTYVSHLANMAVALQVDSLFLECHDNPGSAPSDAECMLPLEDLPPLLNRVCRIRSAFVN